MRKVYNRWLIAVMGTLAHLSIGTVYAWSYFQNPISDHYRWSHSTTAWTFSLAIFVLGLTAAWGGGRLQRFGPRKMALTGSLLYAAGYIIAYFAFTSGSLFLLYLGFGLIGGMGLGLVYVTPVATVSAWFPDRQGLVTGMVVMGFGLGAFVMSKGIAPLLMRLFSNDIAATFLVIGLIFMVLLPFFSFFLQSKEKPETQSQPHLRILPILLGGQYRLIWFMFLFNIVAGMIFLSFQSPLLQDLLRLNGLTDKALLESRGATLIAISALFNGLGRFFWGAVSDRFGRVSTFRLLFAIQIVVFILLISCKNPIVFAAGVCIVLLCYGGGFGVLPSLIRERYADRMASVYGLTLTAWGVGGIIGPQLVAMMKDHFPENAAVFSYFIALILLISGLLSAFRLRKSAEIV